MTAQRRFQLHEEWSRPADVAAFDVKGVGDWLARLEADQRIRDRDRFRLGLQGGLERFKKGPTRLARKHRNRHLPLVVRVRPDEKISDRLLNRGGLVEVRDELTD